MPILYNNTKCESYYNKEYEKGEGRGRGKAFLLKEAKLWHYKKKAYSNSSMEETPPDFNAKRREYVTCANEEQ